MTSTESRHPYLARNLLYAGLGYLQSASDIKARLQPLLCKDQEDRCFLINAKAPFPSFSRERHGKFSRPATQATLRIRKVQYGEPRTSPCFRIIRLYPTCGRQKTHKAFVTPPALPIMYHSIMNPSKLPMTT